MRRAAGEGLALLATKMGTAYQAQLLQQLVETLQHANRGILGHDHGGSSGSGKGSGGGHRGSMGSNWDEADITTGAVFALACLKRASPAVEVCRRLQLVIRSFVSDSFIHSFAHSLIHSTVSFSN